MVKTKAVHYIGIRAMFGTMTEMRHIYLTKKTKSLAIILTAISFLYLLMPFSSALNITIDSPDEVTIGEEFEVEIVADVEEGDTYQIKIFINRSADNKAMSEILVGDEWKIQNAGASYHFEYPEEDHFTIRATIFYDEPTTLCVYMKKSAVISKACVEIELEEATTEEVEEINEESVEEIDNEDTEEEQDNENEEEKESTSASASSSKKVSLSTNVVSSETNDAPIMLNSNNEKSKTVYTKEHKTRTIINYVLAGASILLLFLIATKRI